MKEQYISFPLSNKCLAITTTTALGNLAYQVDNGQGVKKRRKLLADLLNIDEIIKSSELPERTVGWAINDLLDKYNESSVFDSASMTFRPDRNMEKDAKC